MALHTAVRAFLFRMLSSLWLCVLVAVTLAPVSAFALDSHDAVDAPNVRGDLKLSPLPDDFESRKEGWLRLSYPASLEHWAQPLIDEAQAFRKIARERLGKDVLPTVEVRLARNPKEMATLAPIGAPYPKYAVGVAYSSAALILLTEEAIHPNSEHDLRAVFRHELAHVALHDAVVGNHVPLWFNEGFAIHLARENSFGRMRALWTASVSGNLIELKELNRRFPKDVVGVPLAYAQSADVVRFLLRQQTEERFGQLIERVRRGQDFERALYDSYGVDLYSLEQNWLADVDSRYSIWPVLLSGTMIWGGATVLIVVAWRRRRQKAKVTLSRWAKEEALEDARFILRKELEAARTAQNQPHASPDLGPVPDKTPAEGELDSDERLPALPPKEPHVPKVEHDGNWHTLH